MKAHLTNPPEGGKLTACHLYLNAAAYEMPEGDSVLILGGRRIEHVFPEMAVVDLGRRSIRDARRFAEKRFNVGI